MKNDGVHDRPGFAVVAVWRLDPHAFQVAGILPVFFRWHRDFWIGNEWHDPALGLDRRLSGIRTVERSPQGYCGKG